MAYCTSSDIQDLIGESNLAAWSQLDPDTEGADDTRIERAIAWADAWIDGRLRDGRYLLPLAAISGELTVILDVSRRLAAHWLYSSRGFVDADTVGDRMQEHYEFAETTLDRIASGQLKLNATQSRTRPTAPEVVL